MATVQPVPSPSQCFAGHCVNNQGLCCGIHQDPHTPLWSPHLAASLWGGAKNLTRGVFFSLRPSLVQPLLNAAFTLPLPWRFFPPSGGRPQGASNLFQHPPSLLAAKMNHTGSFPVLPVKLLHCFISLKQYMSVVENSSSNTEKLKSKAYFCLILTQSNHGK